MRLLIPAAAALSLALSPAFAQTTTPPASTPPAAAPMAQPSHPAAQTAVKHTAAVVQYNTAANIKMAQQKLKDVGKYAGAVDGKTNSQFRAALIQFQKDHKLEPTGRLNEKTLKALSA